VVGLGKLGLPLAAVIANSGYKTIGIDLNKEHISSLTSKTFFSPEPGLNELLAGNSNLTFSTDFAHSKNCNIYFIIVPTPSKINDNFDDTYLLSAISQLLNSWKDGIGEKTIVVVSTVMPGTCKEIIRPFINDWIRINKSSLKLNLLYSPEFIALGTVVYNLQNPDMTLVGCENTSDTDIFLEIINKITLKKTETQILNLTEAEIVKILINCFVTMKISFANFIGEISNSVFNTDSSKIAKAVGMDTRIGNKYLRPGLGFSGPCFPRDNRALIAFSTKLDLRADLAIATNTINLRQPNQVVSTLQKFHPNANSIGVVGIAYKPHTKVIDESQTLKIARLLAEKNIKVSIFDPILTEEEINSEELIVVDNINLLLECDVVLIAREFSNLEIVSSINFKNTLVI
jgi:UDPglucose 6-dehydrogenase